MCFYLQVIIVVIAHYCMVLQINHTKLCSNFCVNKKIVSTVISKLGKHPLRSPGAQILEAA